MEHSLMELKEYKTMDLTTDFGDMQDIMGGGPILQMILQRVMGTLAQGL